LREVLGINGGGVEVMLRPRHQVIALQSRVRQLEAELAMWEAGQNTRLSQHCKACLEAAWQEVVEPVDPEEQP
jgi:exonuclease VII small subunit